MSELESGIFPTLNSEIVEAVAWLFTFRFQKWNHFFLNIVIPSVPMYAKERLNSDCLNWK